MIKPSAFTALISATVIFGSSLAYGTVKDRFVFDIPESGGNISKMQMDLNQEGQRWFVEVRSKMRNGKVLEGRVGCLKESEGEWACRRFDNGGGFQLRTLTEPEISVKAFTADNEDGEDGSILRGSKSEPLRVKGKRSTISSKNVF